MFSRGRILFSCVHVCDVYVILVCVVCCMCMMCYVYVCEAEGKYAPWHTHVGGQAWVFLSYPTGDRAPCCAGWLLAEGGALRTLHL